jgi:serine/threonine protein kinase
MVGKGKSSTPTQSYDLTNSLIQMIPREIRLWHNLCHENILPFFGITYEHFPSSIFPQAVSPWLENGISHSHSHYSMAKKRAGSAIKYFKETGQTSLIDYFLQVAKGMKYLHGEHVNYFNETVYRSTSLEFTPTIVHGDLKGVR